MGCEPTIGHDGGINFKFERENFVIDVKEGIIEFWDLYWYNIDAEHSHIDKILDALNQANHINLPVIFLPSASNEGKRWLSSVYRLVGEELIITPELITNILNSFFKLKKDFITILQSLIQNSRKEDKESDKTTDEKEEKRIILNEIEFSNNQKEELDLLKEKNKQLFCSALKELGCFLREDQNGRVWMEYQGDTFVFKFQPREIEINDVDWLIINIKDVNTADILAAIRFSNYNTMPSLWASAPYPDGTIKVSSVYRFYNFENDDYVNMVGAILNSFFTAKQIFQNTLNDWSVNKEQIMKNIPEDPELEFIYDINKKKGENDGLDADEKEKEPLKVESEKETADNPLTDIEKQKISFNTILLQLGCQPSFENLKTSEPITFKYQGLEFVVNFDSTKAYIYTVGWGPAPSDPQVALDFFSVINSLYNENGFTPKIMVRYNEENNIIFPVPQFIIPFPAEDELRESSLGISFRMTKECLDSIIEARLTFINKINQILQERSIQDQASNN